ncbi:hypothetical protein [Streptomyces sp. NPDC007346]|uniref:hypothetical protein n=1 Tax=Streptomyces sp. NPDC007346 TaxID=3154682 RepID=UPI003451DBD6
MRMMRGVGLVVAAVLAFGAAGCGADSGGDGAESSASPSVAPHMMGVREALDLYHEASAPGCETADECQELVSAKLSAAEDVMAAMRAEDKVLFAEPIGMVETARQRAEHYGLDNLGAKGNSFAVSEPLQQMVAWFREHPEVA